MYAVCKSSIKVSYYNYQGAYTAYPKSCFTEKILTSQGKTTLSKYISNSWQKQVLGYIVGNYCIF
jgi:hypothetical protein